MPRIVRCSYPFPPQDPPVQAQEPCISCPNADREVLDLHSTISRDDQELREVIRSLTDWMIADASASFRTDVIRYAADLYTRDDHSGTCIPKTVLFAIYKLLQFDSSGGSGLRLSDEATSAIRGETVPRWPDGEPARGDRWAALFAGYSQRYDRGA
jgi:hypothetical protein